jgi:hypothetical protein
MDVFLFRDRRQWRVRRNYHQPNQVRLSLIRIPMTSASLDNAAPTGARAEVA